MTLPLEGSADYEEKTTGANTGNSEVEYNEDNIRHLDDMEHIRVYGHTDCRWMTCCIFDVNTHY